MDSGLKKDFDIEYLKEHKSINMPSQHFHDYFEIYYQLSGQRYYFIDDRVYYVKEGDIVLINSYALHKTAYAGTPNYSRILIYFRKSFLDGFLQNINDIDLFYCFEKKINIISINLSSQSYVEGILFKMLDENKKRESGYLSISKIYLIELLIFLSRYALNSPVKDIRYHNIMHKKISEAVQFINANYNKTFSLKEISQMFNISPFYFCRIFKKVTGFTFIEYLNAIRIKHAQLLLKESDQSITEIAQKVGFESGTHFSRVFKNIMHISPLKYRKKYK
ncbi:AraC family transcriptional regulator [Thermoanaerobacterium sp. RBIITD]|uniref:AraC family transcriptional regulator n=1 Tax=Thermoanaerobacterium sp. RBIITD TaxID=1550240 RepID=UPI000BB99943|nr:AraC family transcriptional regulator [Thermoanaerobacterium sp. RBIITD]SNX53415.1 AraC-type DNA-binding protein [Thermoanaerobacterium sp. RBIITD]